MDDTEARPNPHRISDADLRTLLLDAVDELRAVENSLFATYGAEANIDLRRRLYRLSRSLHWTVGRVPGDRVLFGSGRRASGW